MLQHVKANTMALADLYQILAVPVCGPLLLLCVLEKLGQASASTVGCTEYFKFHLRLAELSGIQRLHD
jgi:hypothetical protein